jgi:GalNAc-alpha-(1->4)-GalNAc-alpha-(1->3)-diNAcBac-PP-undecaprenol alpha-1,4-N-acetyl-D-galactosaminyltransferase
MQENSLRGKITFVISSLGGGGAERVVCTLSNKLIERGYNVSIIRTLHNALNYKLSKNVNLVNLHLGISKRFSVIGTIRRLIRLRKALNSLKPDVIISFTTSTNLDTCLATLGMRRKLIVSERSDPRNIQWLRASMCRLLYSSTCSVVFQTEQASKCLGKRIRRISHVIMNPVQDKLPCYKGERTNKIISVGRLVEIKNTDMLIRAFARLCSEFPQHTLHIYGEGDKRRELEMLCYELGIFERVQFHGFVSSVLEDIADASLYVLTSRHEGMPNSLIEAMAMGIPCISTDCPSGGPAELIQTGENGILIPVGDEEALVSAMRQILSDRIFARKLGENAMKIRERLNIERIVDQWQALIEQVRETYYGR